ncbi:hypothetical protein BS50DRAFT_630576 [Corynespora cassiicola Philippines]|uniref:PEBP-like protein n=1 Tax=Corynespora cassiicola Philippines TaxID=1448308 RepID=A0A2T2P4P3_CORCC|nr:hypothetical protein BS50DRAFT_630576 [Corynespora cassiicola Philippines]
MHISTSVLVASILPFVKAQTPPGFRPKTHINLPASYGRIHLEPGQHLSLNATLIAPATKLPTENSVVIMLDLDTPCAYQNRSFAPFLHWISTPSNLTAIPYAAPAPPSGSPDHRYVLLRYDILDAASEPFRMPQGFTDVGTSLMSKSNFDLDGFARAAGLRRLEAANWFTVSAEVEP